MDIQQLITEIKQDVNRIGHNDYCIIIYTTSGQFGSNRKVFKIYKNLEEFLNKVEKHVKTVDPMFGIYVEIYLFD